MSTFNRDVKIGEEVEQKVCSLLPHPKFLKSFGNERGFDLIGYDELIETAPASISLVGAVRYEVKRDLVGDRTRNLAIEVRYNNEHSGIITTIAERWVHVFSDAVYIMRVDELKEFLRLNRPYLRLTRAGEGAICVLLPRNTLHHIRSLVIHELDTKSVVV